MKHLIYLLHIGAALLASGCGNISFWQFETSTENVRTGQRGPENATEFRCEGNKAFHLRYLEGGKSAWIFFPDRQVRLDKTAGDDGVRYTNGIATLIIQGMEAKLTDGASISYNGCKALSAGAKP